MAFRRVPPCWGEPGIEDVLTAACEDVRFEFHSWLAAQRAMLSSDHDLAKACQYMLRCCGAFTRFLGDSPDPAHQECRQARPALRSPGQEGIVALCL